MGRLSLIAQRVAERLQKSDLAGRTVTLKIKYHDFVINTRSKTLQQFVARYDELMPVVESLLHQPKVPPDPVRLLGISVSNLNHEELMGPQQLTLEF